jgi:hypothetical protein
MAPELRPRLQVRWVLAQHALEPEHERVPDLPVGRGRGVAGLDLRERVVERAAPGRPRREHGLGILVRVQERLAGPGFRPVGVFNQGEVRR